MSSAFCLSTLLRTGRRGLPSQSLGHQHKQQLRHKHRVRVIVTQDLPEGQMRGVYAGEVHDVAAGYARNYLVPKKMAVYATPRNFERCGLVDPALAAAEEAAQQKAKGDDEESEELVAADVLRRYLSNKSVQMKRNTDPNAPIMCHPGHVNAKNLREKLSIQLKVDLEDHETIHIRNEPIVGLYQKEHAELMQILAEMDEEDIPAKKAGEEDNAAAEGETASENASAAEASDGAVEECQAKVKQIGDYLAKISLEGGYVVPLKFTIGRR